MIGIPDDYVIKGFNFKKRPSSNKIAGDFNAGFGMCQLARYAVSGITGATSASEFLVLD